MKQDFYRSFWTFGNHEPLTMYRRIGGRSTGGLDGSALYLERWHNWYDSEECVRIMAENGANILHCRFYKGMGWQRESSDFPAVKRFAERCRKHGIKVLAYVQYSTLYYETLGEEIPELEEWAARDEHGNFVPYVTDASYFRWMPCVNSRGFRDYLKKIIRIAAEADCFDGLMFDNCMAVPCRCSRCLEQFRAFLEERYLPEDFGLQSFRRVRFPSEAAIRLRTEAKDPLIAAALEFWMESNRRSFVELRSYTAELNPSLIFSGNAGSPRRLQLSREWCWSFDHFADCFDLLVCQTGNEPHMIEDSAVNRIREMMACEFLKLPVYPLSDSDAGGEPASAGLLLAQLMECRVWGGIAGDRPIMTPERGQNINRAIQAERGCVNRRFFNLSERYRSYFQAPDIADVGVLLSKPSHELSKESQLALLTWEEVLMRKHIPFRLVVGDGRSLVGLDACRVLILAGQRCLGEGEIRQIREFAQHGGIVIYDHFCGDYDERYRHRETNPFISDGLTEVEPLDCLQEQADWVQAICFPSNGEKVFAGIRNLLENGLHIEAAPEVRCRMVRCGTHKAVHFVNYTGRKSSQPRIEINGKAVEASFAMAESDGFVSWCMAEWE